LRSCFSCLSAWRSLSWRCSLSLAGGELAPKVRPLMG
jgi:hypothetical protein